MATAYATINGRTYYDTDFLGTAYVQGLPDLMQDFVLHAAGIYKDTSSSSNSIGSGSKTFTVSPNKPYGVGTPLRISDLANPTTKYMDVIVTSYSGTTLIATVMGYAGSGTISAWNINIGGSGISISGTIPVAQGGTGATSASAALDSLGAQPRKLIFLDKTTSATILATDSGSVLTNEGAVATVNLDLPTTAKGLIYPVIIRAAQTLNLRAPTGSTIRNGSQVSGSGGILSSNVVGNRATLLATSSSEWELDAMVGVWDLT